jgi:hypothetical protein
VNLSREWVLVGLVGVGSLLLFSVRGRGAAAGDIISASITLVPSDRGELACALAENVGPYRCAFSDGTSQSVPAPAVENTLTPCLTTARAPFLVAGLFEEPTVRNYLSTSTDDQRFTAVCSLKLVASVPAYAVRFRADAAWGKAGPAWVAQPLSCRVE